MEKSDIIVDGSHIRTTKAELIGYLRQIDRENNDFFWLEQHYFNIAHLFGEEEYEEKEDWN